VCPLSTSISSSAAAAAADAEADAEADAAALELFRLLFGAIRLQGDNTGVGSEQGAAGFEFCQHFTMRHFSLWNYNGS
jgi:hypothetical protein